MTTTYYRDVKQYATKRGLCGCGKTRERTKLFYQTLNPFNRNVAGNVKTAGEIRTELIDEIAAWRKEPITCRQCDGGEA